MHRTKITIWTRYTLLVSAIIIHCYLQGEKLKIKDTLLQTDCVKKETYVCGIYSYNRPAWFNHLCLHTYFLIMNSGCLCGIGSQSQALTFHIHTHARHWIDGRYYVCTYVRKFKISFLRKSSHKHIIENDLATTGYHLASTWLALG